MGRGHFGPHEKQLFLNHVIQFYLLNTTRVL